MLLMPAAGAPLRSDERLFNYRERFHILRILFATEIAAGRVILSTLEKTLPKPNFTIATLEALQQLCPTKPVIVIGADQAANLARWHRADELLQQYEFVIFARQGSEILPQAGIRCEVIANFDEDISATALRAHLSGLAAARRVEEVLKLMQSGDQDLPS